MLLQLLINGLVLGAIYSLVSLGFTIVYNTTKILHIAYSVLFVFPVYMIILFSKGLGTSFPIAVIAALIINMALSVLIESAIYQPLIKRKSSLNVIFVSSIGVMIVLVNLLAILFGNETRVINSSISKSFTFLGYVITYTQITQFTISVATIMTFLLLLKSSQFGIRTRAIRDDDLLCSVLGLNVKRMRMILFACSGVLVGIAGILMAYDVGVTPYYGMPVFLSAVVALIIGGIGRFESPILGGFILGGIQSVSIILLASKWQNVIIFGIFILFLLFRPQGLIGTKQRLV